MQLLCFIATLYHVLSIIIKIIITNRKERGMEKMDWWFCETPSRTKSPREPERRPAIGRTSARLAPARAEAGARTCSALPAALERD